MVRIRRIFTLFAALSITLAVLPTAAQQQGEGAVVQDDTEDHTAAFGIGATLFRVSISKHGNVVRFETPAGIEHIRLGGFIEGYLISSGPANTVHGYDAAFAESAWGAASAVGSLAAGTLVITRTTADGAFLLTQAFKIGPANLKLTITMTLKNVSGADKTNVQLTRYADWDVNNTFTGDTFQSGPLSVFALDGYGVLTSAQAAANPSVVFQDDGISLTVFNQTPYGGGNPAFIDGQARIAFPLGIMANGASKTVKIFYQRY